MLKIALAVYYTVPTLPENAIKYTATFVSNAVPFLVSL
jgi:hypothetical protein